MELIDKSALVAKIRKRLLPVIRDKHYDEWEEGQDSERIAILDVIDTLEVKEVDLDNFIKEEFDKYSCVDGYGQLSVSYNMVEFYSMIKRLTKAQKGE